MNTPATDPSASGDAVFHALLSAFQGGPAADDQALQHHLTSTAQAYAIQHRLVAALSATEATPRCWKSGGPSRQQPLTHAPLPPAGVRASGATLDGLHLRHRWIEAEVALRIAREVSAPEAAQLAAQDAAALVDGLCVSIEVVDSRWASARTAAPLLKLADLQSHGALVLGDFTAFVARPWDEQECRVRIGGAAWQSFRGTHSLGDPAWLLPVWLRHVTREGQPVAAGTVVTTGTWCGLLEARAGDRVEVEFPGIGQAVAQL